MLLLTSLPLLTSRLMLLLSLRLVTWFSFCGTLQFLQCESLLLPPNFNMALSPKDPSSFSRPELCEVKHLHLDLDVNFQKHILSGKARLDLEKKTGDVTSVVSP